VIFDPDENGTIAVPQPLSYPDCVIDAGDDDVIGVRLEWEEVASAASYRVYRSDGTDDTYSLVTEFDEVCQDDVCIFFDDTVTSDEHTYFVVAVQGGHEGPGQIPPTTVVDNLLLVDDLSTSEHDEIRRVRNVIARDGRDFYITENKKARKILVMWSRVPEAGLAGYHVYRRCRWKSPGGFSDQLRDLSCTHSWTRLTASPVDEEFFVDWTTGDLREHIAYAVRPVSIDGVEGAWPERIVRVDVGFEPVGSLLHCYHSFAYDIFNKHPRILEDPSPGAEVEGSEQERIDVISKGPGDPTGAPATPTIVDKNDSASMGQYVCYKASGRFFGQAFYYGDDCELADDWDWFHPQDQANARIDYEWAKDASDDWSVESEWGMFAYVDWEQNQEMDLAGYHVEMAGSTEGPWVRVTRNPIAWWETHYDARVWRPDDPDTDPGASPNVEWAGPACAVFRVIAVDEGGRESEPSEPFQVAPVPELNAFNVVWTIGWPGPGYEVPEQNCSPTVSTLAAPQSLVADTVEIPGVIDATQLTWNQVPGAHAYRVYRNTLRDWHHYYFYITGVVLDTGPDCVGGVCTFIEDGSDTTGNDQCPDHFSDCDLGMLDAFYVTAIEYAAAGEMPHESPRSNIVMWHHTGGYARLFDDVEVWDAIAVNASDSNERPWCEEPELVCEGIINSDKYAMTASVDTTFTSPTTAPLLTLGQSSPTFEIFDLHVDHLGSTRAVTNNDGEIVSQHDFLPFGEEIAPMFDYNTKIFTGHERDLETGFDYMLARYYDNRTARFRTVDKARARLRDPQSWNRYSYVWSNPLNLIDLEGEYPTPAEWRMQEVNLPWYAFGRTKKIQKQVRKAGKKTIAAVRAIVSRRRARDERILADADNEPQPYNSRRGIAYGKFEADPDKDPLGNVREEYWVVETDDGKYWIFSYVDEDGKLIGEFIDTNADVEAGEVPPECEDECEIPDAEDSAPNKQSVDEDGQPYDDPDFDPCTGMGPMCSG
jgi:RHS repeat-associated protein